MKISDVVYKLATGPKLRRQILTPVVAGVFTCLMGSVLAAGMVSDHTFALPSLLPGPVGFLVGLLLVIAGLAVWAFCVLIFLEAQGTPVPVNPPHELVDIGPYSWVRNPMMTGVFAILFGLGFLLHSVSIVFVWTPLFVVLNLIELKMVEEPELERRLGNSYVEYRRRVPMFFPRLWRHRE